MFDAALVRRPGKASMNISGILVYASPNSVDKVRIQLEKIAGVEIHADDAGGKMVVTIEKADDQETTRVFDSITRTPGVLSAAMVYHHFEADVEPER